MPCGASSSASASVRRISPALAATYAGTCFATRKAEDRGDVDDRAAALRVAHRLRRAPRDAKRAVEVGVERRAANRPRSGRARARERDAGVVDEDVDAPACASVGHGGFDRSPRRGRRARRVRLAPRAADARRRARPARRSAAPRPPLARRARASSCAKCRPSPLDAPVTSARLAGEQIGRRTSSSCCFALARRSRAFPAARTSGSCRSRSSAAARTRRCFGALKCARCSRHQAIEVGGVVDLRAPGFSVDERARRFAPLRRRAARPPPLPSPADGGTGTPPPRASSTFSPPVMMMSLLRSLISM